MAEPIAAGYPDLNVFRIAGVTHAETGLPVSVGNLLQSWTLVGNLVDSIAAVDKAISRRNLDLRGIVANHRVGLLVVRVYH